ncbi:MAG: hypothetical protein COV70_01930 [Parcubacteria group bacterium CG11_big_fil_rev_8_21_14_0_20_39_22]|nr:MAG: hypothetical protein COV70_01930 [Parcubacteria group bacterium CG11_big_fil_rev_8_21_14_0_20_39_22]
MVYHIYMKDIIRDLTRAIRDDEIPLRSASLAYYALFALAPFLIIAVFVGGLVMEETAAEIVIIEYASTKFGSDTAVFIKGLFSRFANLEQNFFIAGVSIVALLFGVMRFFNYLWRTFFKIFNFQIPEENPVKRSLYRQILAVSYTILVVMLFGILTTFNILSSTIFSYSSQILPVLPEFVWKPVEFAVSYVFLALLFGVLYQVVSPSKIKWRSSFAGAALTATLFAIINILVIVFINFSATTSLYGGVGFILAILLWVYYASNAVFIGAETAKTLELHSR